MYALGAGRTRIKKNETMIIELVLTESRRRKEAVSPENNVDERTEKKNALSPNPANGSAVAVPRWLGKFNAAIHS